MRSTDTREHIVEAALALVADRGFSATSVDDIAAAAHVAKGSVFYNFGSKAGLFEAIIAEGVSRLTVALRSAADGLHGRAAVEALVAELLRQVHQHPDFAKVMAAEAFRTGRSWQDSIRQLRDESIGTFAAVVADAWPERDPSITASAVFGGTLLAGLEWLAFQPERSLDDVCRGVLHAVHCRAPHPPAHHAAGGDGAPPRASSCPGPAGTQSCEEVTRPHAASGRP